MTRRQFVSTSAIALASAVITPINMNAENSNNKIKAIAFDGFVIFDPKPVQTLITIYFGEKGQEFGTIWRSKQFEYTWLRTVTEKYKDFWEVTEDALHYTLKKTGLSLSDEQKKALMDQFLHLSIWPEVVRGLQILKEKGYKLAYLSNFTEEMMKSNNEVNKIEKYFDFKLSTDKVRAFKPSPKAYQMGISTFNLKKEEILFAAFGAWDAAGAKAFGYPTYWVNRQQVPLEELDSVPDGTGRNFNDLLHFLKI